MYHGYCNTNVIPFYTIIPYLEIPLLYRKKITIHVSWIQTRRRGIALLVARVLETHKTETRRGTFDFPRPIEE